ncbi:MAG: efflux RND transporter periplasmic adaptor subunit [Phycisphaerales bacterium]
MSLTRGFLTALTLAATAAGASAQEGPPSAAVRVGVVEMRPVEQRASVTGEVRATQRSRIATREPGRVIEVLVREGDVVKAGDVLVRLDASLLQIDLSSAEAQLSAANSALIEANSVLERRERDLARLQQLRSRESATDTEVQDAQSEVDAQAARATSREAEILFARARIQRLQEQLGDMTVRAPFNGRVSAKLVDEGEWAGEGAAVVEVVTSDTVDVFLEVPQRYVNAVQSPEATISVRFDAIDIERALENPRVVPVADTAARTFPVRMVAKNDEGLIQPGMTVTASIPAGFSGPAMLAPADSLLRDDAGWFVYTATDNGQGGRIALPARVTQLFRIGDQVAIRPISGPIFPGAVVVTEGNERILFPGQPLEVTNPDAIPPAPPQQQGAQGQPAEGASR